MKSYIGIPLACLYAFTLQCRSQGMPALTTNEQRFYAPDNGVDRDDEFGGAIAADGEWAVVGTRFDDSALLRDEGSAYVLKWAAGVPAGSWKIHQKLNMPMTAQERNRQTNGQILFGQRVAISGEWMAVSAPRFKTATGRLGRIVVYKRDSNSWALAQIIEPENSYSGYTGAAMVISNDRLAFASNHGTVHVYSRSPIDGQPPWSFHTTIAVSTTSGETGISLALRNGHLLMGLPGMAASQGESVPGHIREYEFRQFHASLLATIPSPVFTQPNELKSFASSIAVSEDWMLVSSNGLSGTNAKIFSYRRTLATNGSVTWGLVGNTSVTVTEFAKAPAIVMNDRYAVVTTIASRGELLRTPVTTLNGPDLSSLQEIGQIFPQSMRLQENDLYQLVAVAGDTILAADAASSAAGEIVAIPQGHRGLDPQRLSPPKSYLSAQDGMGSTVAASGNLVAVSAPQWQPTYVFNAPTPQRGTVHLYRRINGLWEYSDSVNNIVNGPVSPAFGTLMSVNSRWLAINGREGVYAYRVVEGKAADLPSFSIRSHTNPNATLLNFEFDPFNESTLIVAWKNGDSGTLVERFTMPTSETEVPLFQSALTQSGADSFVSMAVENGLAAISRGLRVSIYNTATNPWRMVNEFSTKHGTFPIAPSDGLFFNDGQILQSQDVDTIGYDEKSRKWTQSWNAFSRCYSARRNAALVQGAFLVDLRTLQYDRLGKLLPQPKIFNLRPIRGADQPSWPMSATLTEDSAIVGTSTLAGGYLGMIWMRSLEGLKLFEGPAADSAYQLSGSGRKSFGMIAQNEPTELQFTLQNSGSLVTTLSNEDFTFTASGQGTKVELLGWDKPRAISAEGSITFKLRIAPVAFPQNQTIDIVIRGPTSKRILVSTGFSFSVPDLNPPVPAADLTERANLVAMGETFSIRLGPEVSLSLDLQWFKDGRPLKGQTFPILYMNSVKAADAGIYQIRVQNRYGQSAIAGVYPLGVYEYQASVLVKRRTESFALSMKAWGPGIKYRWNEGQDTAFVQGSRTMTLRVSRASELFSGIAGYVTLGAAVQEACNYSLIFLPETSLVWVNPTSITLEDGNPWRRGVQMTAFGGESLAVGRLKITGLPPGIIYDSITNTFQGAPTAAGSYDLTITRFLDELPNPPPLKVRVYVNANRFAVDYPKGSWAGIVHCFPSNELDQLLPGMLKLNMTEDGRFSGLWIIGDRRLSFTAQYRGNGNSAPSAVVKIPNYSSVGDLQLTFGYSNGYTDTSRDAITLEVSVVRDASAVASIQSSLKRVLAPTAATSRIVGRYSAFIEQAIDQLSVGSGLMSFSISPQNDISSVGTFANGQGFTGTGTVLDNGLSKQLLHYAFAKPGDTLSGQTELGDDLTFQETKEMTWKSEPNPKSRLYAEGFELAVQLVGAKHFAPAPGMLLFGGIDQSTPTVFSLEHTSLFPEPIRSPFRLTTQHSAIFPAPNRNRLKMDFYAPTGFFTGSFTTTDLLTNEKPFTRNANFRGMVIPGINRGGGFFLMPALPDPLNEPSVSSSPTPIYSGKVSLNVSQ